MRLLLHRDFVGRFARLCRRQHGLRPMSYALGKGAPRHHIGRLGNGRRFARRNVGVRRWLCHRFRIRFRSRHGARLCLRNCRGVLDRRDGFGCGNDRRSDRHWGRRNNWRRGGNRRSRCRLCRGCGRGRRRRLSSLRHLQHRRLAVLVGAGPFDRAMLRAGGGLNCGGGGATGSGGATIASGRRVTAAGKGRTAVSTGSGASSTGAVSAKRTRGPILARPHEEPLSASPEPFS